MILIFYLPIMKNDALIYFCYLMLIINMAFILAHLNFHIYVLFLEMGLNLLLAFFDLYLICLNINMHEYVNLNNAHNTN